MLSLALLGLILAQPAEQPEGRDSGFDGLAAPIVSYSSDMGFGAGAVGGTYIYGPGYRPYRHGIAGQVFFTTRGIQNHFLRYDGPSLIGRARVEARLEYRRETLSPFYGPGNLSAPEWDGDTNDPRFNYRRVMPSGWLRLRGHPFGQEYPLQVYLGYSLRHVSVRTYDDSVLEEQQPFGLAGGWNGQLSGGVVWDTRDDETNPTEGGMEELALRLSGEPLGGGYRFAGVTLGERRFWSLGPRFVFAQRLAFDAMFGDVPFWEWPSIGGVSFTEGIGGMSTVRGVVRNRFAGNVKLFSNSELRARIADVKLLKWTATLGAVGYVDLGRVWHPGVDDGHLGRWHPGVGGGLRLSRRSAVLRFDTAASTELFKPSFYVTFGQMF